MKSLDLETLIVDYDDYGVVGVRLPDDRVGDSSLHSVLEQAMIESDAVRALVEDADEEPQELDFEVD